MKTIIITGTFSSGGNNRVKVNVFRPSTLPNPYDFERTYNHSFVETLSDLVDDTNYDINLSGNTTSHFDIEIVGDFKDPNPIIDSFSTNSIIATYPIKTD